MKITIEMSLYPLHEDFKETIKAFIAELKAEEQITAVSNNVSTQISGDYDYVMDLIKEKVKPMFEQHKAVFVMKFLSGDKING